MSEKNQKYFIGLDLGTASVGYAVMDENCKVLRLKGKRAWGSVLFDEGKSAASTRTQRSARRRYERRKERIRLLQSLTADTVLSVDPSFFARLENSYLLNVKEDEVFGRDNIYNLFDGDYTDKNYYAEYKTIYHLRKRLCENKSKADPRLVYLALHHIIKYRGNFLHDEEKIETGDNGFTGLLDVFFEKYKETCNIVDEESGEITEDETVFDCTDGDRIASIMRKKIKNGEKKDEIVKLLTDGRSPALLNENAVSLKKKATAFANLLLGYKANLMDLFNVLESDEACTAVIKISFDGSDYEEKSETFPAVFGDDGAETIGLLYSAYCAFTLEKIIGEGKKYVYEGMVERYETNAAQLSDLKAVLSEKPDVYRKFFSAKGLRKCEGKNITFDAYMKPHLRGKRNAIGGSVQRDDFYKEVTKLIKDCAESEAKSRILAAIEEKDFLIKLNSTRNAVIPYQLNLNELEIILENQGEYYPELKENRDKIISILTFRRPYSVGVINPESRFSWIKKEDLKAEKAYPWNFEEVVNCDKASDRFIRALTNRCTYFKDEKVLPANSIIYQIFNVLNELANVRIVLDNDAERRLTVEEKKKALRLFFDNSSVNKKMLLNLLSREFGVVAKDLKNLSSESGKFVSKMSGYRAVRAEIRQDPLVFNGEDVLTNYELFDLYEKIIEIMTVFNDVKIKRRALDKLLVGVDEKIVINLAKRNLEGWGRLSKKCIVGVKDDMSDRCVLDVMYLTDKNFSSVIHADEYDFKQKFFSKNTEVNGNIRYSEINELYLSPAVKRTVWQAVKVVGEIVKIVGNEPRGIYIESTRQDSEKKVSKKRIDKINELYKKVREDADKENAYYFSKEADSERKKYTDSLLDDDMLYLYLLQMGKSMYSGKPLDIRRLSETCEIDHVVPRHFVKDDSIENRVLVLKEENQEKSGTLVIKKNVRDKMTPFWQYLLRNGFMTKKKYYNLIKDEYTDKDYQGFINRQLDETNKSMKSVRDLLSAHYVNTDVEFVKAGISSVFRSFHTEKGYSDFFKIRDLNDFHHAKDAYLACVIGYFTRKIYPVWGANSSSRLIRDELRSACGNDVWELCEKRYGIIVDAMISATPDNHNGVEWNVCYNNVLSVFSNNDILVTKKKEELMGAFYKATIFRENTEQGTIPLRYVITRNGEKKPLSIRYGALGGDINAYLVFAIFQNGEKTKEKLVGVPTRIAYAARNDENAVDRYFVEKFNSNNSKRIKYLSYVGKKILKYQLIRYEGQLCYLTSDSELINAEQLLVDKNHSLVLYCIAHPQMKVFFNKEVYRLTDPVRKDEFERRIKDFITDYCKKIIKRYPLYGKRAEEIKKFITTREYSDLPVYSEKNVCKADYVSKLLALTAARSSSALDMSKYGSIAACGRLRGKTIYKDKIDLIDTSITGIYCSKKMRER